MSDICQLLDETRHYCISPICDSLLKWLCHAKSLGQVVSMKQEKEPLRSFDQLPPDIERRLRGVLRAYTYSTGEAIFIQEETAEAIYLVASGRVKVVRVTPEGYESILCVRGPGDYFCPVPLMDGGNHLGTAIAMSRLTLFACEPSEFNSLCQDSPELLAAVQAMR